MGIIILSLLFIAFAVSPFIFLGMFLHYLGDYRRMKKENELFPDCNSKAKINRALIIAILFAVVLVVFVLVCISLIVMLSQGIVYM